MPLDALIINGFKSFADKTTIKFNSGITGIVGPNGSGKSNITEAIRWVMGEGSAKSLRGENMKDIIFAGSQFRAPLNSAQVTLIFDNHDHQLNINNDEVSITRKILRNGDSEYLINNNKVRLRDIRDLFIEMGMSQDSLAIISQGKVDQILNSKPEDRRSLFEEAAGVLHFKQQKQAALRELDKTNDNLIRINDLVKELEDRVEPLAEQSSLAKQYKFQKSQLDEKMKQLLAINLNQLERKRQEITKVADKNNKLLTKLDEEVKKSKSELEGKKSQSSLLQDKKETQQQNVLNLTQKIADLNTQLQVKQQSSKYNEATKAEYSLQKQELLANKKNLKNKAEMLQVQAVNQAKNLESLQSKIHQLQENFSDNPEALNKRLDDLRNDYIENLQEQANLHNAVINLRKEKDRLKNSSVVENKELTSKLAEANNQLAKLAEHGKKLQNKKQSLEKQVEEIKKDQVKFEQQLNNLTNRKNELLSHLNEYQAQVDALKRLQQRHEGYYFGVKYVLNHLSDFSGIVGVIGELITFPEKLQAALTTALGSGVQNLVAVDQESARLAIRRLKTTHSGRATFLPLDGLRQHKIPTSTLKILEGLEGFLGVASDLVASNSKHDLRNAINYLLGNVLIVQNLEVALRVQKRIGNYYRIVTLDGDIISPGGSMTGGAKNQRNNSPLATNSEIDKLTRQVATIKEKLKKLSQSITEIDSQLEKTNQQTITFSDDLGKVSEAYSQTNFEYQSQKKEVNRLTLLQKQQDEGQKLKAQELEKIQLNLEKIKNDESNISKKIASQKQEMADMKQSLADFDTAYNKFQKEISDLKAQYAVEKNKQENLIEQQKQLQTQLKNTDKQIEVLTEKIDQLVPVAADVVKTLRNQLKQLDQDKQKANEKLILTNENLGKLTAQIGNLELIANRNYELRKNAALEQEQTSVEQAKISEKMNHYLTQLRQDYGLTYEAAIKLVKQPDKEEYKAQLEKDIHLHKMSLEDIGPVNLQAIEEYEDVKSRYDFLNGQQEDLLTARKNIETSMSQLDDEVKIRFEKTFKEISKSFEKIFPMMFGGGNARLMLTQPDNLLETGIEIIAQPPGKKLQNLSLLSGGERALTAITLLFAMLQVNPVPFCILDEVEAALDEANVSRFAEFLNEYDFATQFIVITHRRGTMQKADNLYGVTMQESGVSQVLSVSLSELREEGEK
ncbi:chromosome segregation protein SMC [Lactobacillus sp. PV037]|uniref:chromosome segregation protein SMC n=1 Tax=Lactobacillus sp. PV037 TaxID=2594496 RepID=UPI0022404D3A|nr:chromosome segregation protein SMC [Lactobacillus sp. PV037]QNQ83864.1 chromosome segregation protein SMC [Lactobacillus sp. PV037]